MLRAPALSATAGGGDVSDSMEFHVAAQYTAHGTGSALGYGADWAPTPARDDGGLLAATCSFYDRQLHVWRYSDDADGG